MLCPLCGREMTAIETYAGRGELYCGHCDLTIGGNEAKTPDELVALLEQRTCKDVAEPPSDGTFWPAPHFECSKCGHKHVSMSYVFFCPNCGRRVVDE